MRKQLSPPLNWQDFEDMCLGLFRVVWKDPYAAKNGRLGQPQSGVDIWGTPHGDVKLAGVQCKLKDMLTKGRLGAKELKTEVEKAKGFRPQLSEYIIATTCPKDSGIEEVARGITQQNRLQGLFSVAVLGWEDIVALLYETDVVSQFSDEIALKIIRNDVSGMRELLEDRLPPKSQMRQEITVSAAEAAAVILTPEFSGELDHAKNLLEESRPGEALRFLERTKERIWAQSPPIIRYRLLTNLGAARLALGQDREASCLFLEALQYNPDEEKALCNAALGYLLLGQHDQAREFATRVVQRNPGSVSAHALLVHASSDVSLQQIISAIPPALLTRYELAYALGHAYMTREEPREAQLWFEKALRECAPAISVQIKAYLAASIIETERRAHPGYFLHAGRETVERISRAEMLLTEAWDTVKTGELTPDRVAWVHNRAVARRVLGNLRGALDDVDQALTFDPSSGPLTKNKAILLCENGRNEEAIALLTGIKDDPAVPEAPLLLAQALRSQGKTQEAIRFLDSFLERDITKDLKSDGTRLRIRLMADEGRFDQAVGRAEQLVVEEESVLNLVEAAYVNGLMGRTERSLEYVSRARGLLTDESPFWDILAVADELYLLQETEQASGLYERVVEPTSDTPLTRRLVRSLTISGDLGKALDICNTVLASSGPTKFYSEVEAGIYEEVGDLPGAKVACEEYLSTNPQDSGMSLRLAVIEYRSGETTAVDRILDQPLARSGFSLQQNIQLAQLLAARGRAQQSLEVIYETRRDFYSDGEAHIAYLLLFITAARGEPPFLAPSVVGPRTAVCLEDETGKRLWYVIDDRSTPSPERGELGMAHPLVKALLGKSVGDVVPYKEGSIRPETLRIVDLRSMYVHAFEASGEQMETLFPGTPGFMSVRVGEPNPDNTPTEGMGVVLKEVITDHERAKRVVELYSQGILTIGQLAALLGRNEVDVMRSLTSSPEIGVRCANGDIGSVRAAKEAIAGRKRLVADMTALMTMNWLAAKDALPATFGRIAVSQSTVDLLNESMERLHLANQGYSVIGMANGRLTLTEVPPEEVKRMRDDVASVLEWVKTEADVLPCKPALRIKRNQRASLGEVLGRSFADTILVAAEQSCILFSEDMRLREFAAARFGISGVWSQVVLHTCNQRDTTRDEEFWKSTVKLVRLNYRYTWINDRVLMEAAREANWSLSEPFHSVVRVLGSSDRPGAVATAALFLRRLFMEPIPVQRVFLVQAVLDSLTQRHEPALVLRDLSGLLKRHLALMPQACSEALRIVRDWSLIRRTPLRI